MSIRSTWRALGAAVLVATALLAAGCGSSKNSQTTTISTADWANGVCGAAVTYQASLTDAVTSLTGNLSKSGLQDVADQVKSATDTFISTTKDLGKPNTTDGQQAKQTLDTLASGLDKDVSTIKDAATNGVVSGIPAITSALTTAQSQITTAFNDLKGLDPAGELGTAFSQAPPCASFTGS